jgi:hypothetical protein
MKIILVVVVLLVSVYVYNKIVKGTTVILKCNKNGGECVPGTCNWLTQVPALSDNAAGCKSGELCCINITLPETKDPYCEGKNIGDACRTDENTNYYCDPGLVCKTRCEYCATVRGDPQWSKPCDAIDIPKFKAVNNPTPTNQFVCACNKTECSQADINSGKCILGYCPSTNPATYCCLTDPAKHVIPTTNTETNSGTTTSTSTTNTAPVTITNTAPTYPPAQVTDSSTSPTNTPSSSSTGSISDYDFLITDAWFDATHLPDTCHLESDRVITCDCCLAYTIPVYFTVYNSNKLIGVHADPYVTDRNGNTIKGLGTYLGIMPEAISTQSSKIVTTNMVISSSEASASAKWTIHPGVLCDSTDCSKVDPTGQNVGIIKTSESLPLTIQFQSTVYSIN